MLALIKKYWFAFALLSIGYLVFSIMGNLGSDIRAKKCNIESDRPGCYIFYGIGQNDIEAKGGKLKVNYLIEGFPYKHHAVYVEIIKPSGIDFLYSQRHTANHKAHAQKVGKQRLYKATYKIPPLPKGSYKLRITFKFDYLLGTKDLVSNDIKFKVK